MTRRRRLLVAAIALAWSAAACAPLAPSPSILPTALVPSSPVVGVVTSIDSSGLSQVHGFTLRDSGGHSIDFVVGQLENGAEFPPGHLGEHQITAEPVEVWFRVENGQFVVYRLADAASAPASRSP